LFQTVTGECTVYRCSTVCLWSDFVPPLLEAALRHKSVKSAECPPMYAGDLSMKVMSNMVFECYQKEMNRRHKGVQHLMKCQSFVMQDIISACRHVQCDCRKSAWFLNSVRKWVVADTLQIDANWFSFKWPSCLFAINTYFFWFHDPLPDSRKAVWNTQMSTVRESVAFWPAYIGKHWVVLNFQLEIKIF
jgi:hypothetical protein